MQVKQYLHMLKRDDISTVGDVALALQTLNQKLPVSELQHLQNFNTAYLVITKRVQQSLERGRFQHPDFLHVFDSQFASYYFDALLGYLQHEPIPAAWFAAFEHCRQPNASPLVAVALGVNAHINNDIPQVLRDCAATQYHFQDYLLINHIIKDSFDEVLSGLQPSISFLRPQRRLLRPGYKIVMELLVRRWRKKAWYNYQQLARREMSQPQLESYAHGFVRPILALPT